MSLSKPRHITYHSSQSFSKVWNLLSLTEGDLEDLKNGIDHYIANAPDNNYGNFFPGDRVEGTGGVFKYRYSPEGTNTGKSGSL